MVKDERYKLYQGDCLEIMDELISLGGKCDAIITDPPYGTTACKWDSVIPFDEMWDRINKLIKSNGAIVLFGSEPFSSNLRMSNIKNYKYDWVWNKKKAGNIFLAKYQPMKIHENILVFSNGTANYYPIKIPRDKIKKSKNYGTGESMGGRMLNLSEFEVIKREENEYYYKFTIIAKERPVVCTQCLWDETPILGDNKRFTIHSSK